jgi:general L-amino acid transport system substrate-binding protein
MKRRRVLAVGLGVMLVISGLAGTAGAGSQKLSDVLTRGHVLCGVSGLAGGWSLETSPDVYEGFDADMCRVVAAAVFGDPSKVEFVELTSGNRFAALRDDTVDVVFRTTTNTLTRDALASNGGEGVSFGPTYFYDGQSFLVDTSSKGLARVDSDSTLANIRKKTRVCLTPGTITEVRFLEAATAAGKAFTVVETFDIFGDFSSGECDLITLDRSALGSFRASQIDGGNAAAEDWVVLNQTISKEPLAPVVADGDEGWLAIVTWSINATLYADELGINASNIDTRREESVEVSRAFGSEAASTGGALGLGVDWAYDVIVQVGNYGDIYGASLEPIGLSRAGTLNDSYLGGGLLYAPPIR